MEKEAGSLLATNLEPHDNKVEMENRDDVNIEINETRTISAKSKVDTKKFVSTEFSEDKEKKSSQERTESNKDFIKPHTSEESNESTTRLLQSQIQVADQIPNDQENVSYVDNDNVTNQQTANKVKIDRTALVISPSINQSIVPVVSDGIEMTAESCLTETDECNVQVDKTCEQLIETLPTVVSLNQDLTASLNAQSNEPHVLSETDNLDETNENLKIVKPLVSKEVHIISNEILQTTIDLTNIEQPVQNIENVSALNMLSAYVSDSDSNDSASVVEVPTSSNSYYRDVITVNSNADSDSSDSDLSESEFRNVRKALNKFVESDVDDDDEEYKNKKKTVAKVKGELTLDDLPAIEDLKITVPSEKCQQLGNVHSIVEQLVLVSALPNSTIVDLDTVLFLDQGQRALGTVFDVLGQISEPLYCVRFNSHEHITEKEIKIGDKVYVAPKTEHTTFVILSNLLKLRGSDASWENDIEPPPHCLDFSDDEQEREARQRLRRKNKCNDNESDNHGDNTKKKHERVQDDNEAGPSRYIQRRQHRGRGTYQNYRSTQSRHYPYNAHNQNSAHPVTCSPNYNPSSWHSNYQFGYNIPTAAFAPNFPPVTYMQPPTQYDAHQYGQYYHGIPSTSHFADYSHDAYNHIHNRQSSNDYPPQPPGST